jgi:hypothetical protein
VAARQDRLDVLKLAARGPQGEELTIDGACRVRLWLKVVWVLGQLFIELSSLIGLEEGFYLSVAILHDLIGKPILVILRQGLEIKEQLNLPGPLFKDAGNAEALILCQLEILGQAPKLLVGIGQTQIGRVGSGFRDRGVPHGGSRGQGGAHG